MTEISLAPVRRTRWIFVALVASLAVNAFFVGAVATDFFRFTAAEKKPVHFELRWLEQRLGAADFESVAAAVAAARPQAEMHIARLRELRHELGVLAAEPQPDRVMIDAKLGEIRAELAMMLEGVQDTAITAVLALPAEARLPLAAQEADQP